MAFTYAPCTFQVYVDASTPAEVWDVLRKAVEEFTAEHPENFSGQCAVFCFGAGDPLKMLLGVYFEYSFNGAISVIGSCHEPAQCQVPAHYLRSAKLGIDACWSHVPNACPGAAGVSAPSYPYCPAGGLIICHSAILAFGLFHQPGCTPDNVVWLMSVRIAGVDQGRLNVARHGLYMCIRQVLNEQNVVYSMPTFRSGGSVSTPPGLGRNGDAAGSSHAPPPGATPPSVPVQHAVSRASQAGWLPGQRGDDQIEGLRALVPGTIREQLT